MDNHELKELLDTAWDGSLDALSRLKQFCEKAGCDGHIIWSASSRKWSCNIWRGVGIGYCESSGPSTAVRQAILAALDKLRKDKVTDESAGVSANRD